MVSVTPVNDLSARSCNCCTEKADIEIHFANWNNTRDSVIVLCNRCASDLKRRLRDDTMNGLIEEAADAIEELSGLISCYDGETGIKDLQEYASKYWGELRRRIYQIQNARAEGGMSVEDVVFVRQKQLCEIILNNLFSEDTNRFFENCEFSSYRTAFMQGMNYAAILCNAKLDQYPAVMVHEPPREET